MCKPKNEGGTRCLGHSAFTRYLKKYLTLSTGASEELITEEYKKLSKEGRNMEAPSKKEFEKEILENKIDLAVNPNINAHDKKILNNQLDTALAEAKKQGVTAKAWHVWKNLRTRVMDRLNTLGQSIRGKAARTALSVGLIGTIAFGAAGCSVPKNDIVPAPSETSTSQTETPTNNEPAVYGDAITLVDADGNPVIVENEHGTYEHVTINPEDDAYTDFSKIDEASLTSNGFTVEDGQNAQKFAAKWVVEEGIDGPGLDSDTGYDKWVNENADAYLMPAYKSDLLSNEQGGKTLLIANKEVNRGPFISDGKARVADIKVTVTKVEGYIGNDGNPYIAVTGEATAKYRVNNKELLETTKASNPGVSEEEIIRQYPQLGKEGTSLVNSKISFIYGLDKTDNGFQFGAYDINYDKGTLE